MPYGFQNGRFNLIRTAGFRDLSTTGILRKAGRFAVEGDLLYRHPAVRQVAIVAMPDARLGERACAFVVPREAASLAFTEMQEFLLKSGVARSYWPERLELVDTLPMTATGKIQKFVLRERAKDLVETQDICPAAEGARNGNRVNKAGGRQDV